MRHDVFKVVKGETVALGPAVFTGAVQALQLGADFSLFRILGRIRGAGIVMLLRSMSSFARRVTVESGHTGIFCRL